MNITSQKLRRNLPSFKPAFFNESLFVSTPFETQAVYSEKNNQLLFSTCLFIAFSRYNLYHINEFFRQIKIFGRIC
jgi:hypothetical protein